MSHEKYPFDWQCEIGEYLFSSQLINESKNIQNDYNEMVKNHNDFIIKTHDTIPLLIIKTDNKEGLISFPDLNSVPDLATGFYISDPKGWMFLEQLWNYYWNQGKLFTV